MVAVIEPTRLMPPIIMRLAMTRPVVVTGSNCQYLWIGVFQATSVSVC